jgi:hypothetical protein
MFFFNVECPEGPGSITLAVSDGSTSCYKGPHKKENYTYVPSNYRKDLTKGWKNVIRSFSFSTAKPEIEATAVMLGSGDETTCRRGDVERVSRPRDGPHLGG